jgi:hypothetical protein
VTPAGPSTSLLTENVRPALRGLRFPAERWEIVTQAEFYGADRRTRTLLAGLPDGRYTSLAAIATALTVRAENLLDYGDRAGKKQTAVTAFDLLASTAPLDPPARNIDRCRRAS